MGTGWNNITIYIFLFDEVLTQKMALEQYFLEEGKNVSDLSTMALIYRLFSDYRLDKYSVVY